MKTVANESETAVMRRKSRAILIALLFPTMAIILNNSVFSVALPTIRDEFLIDADVAAWLTVAFSLPFMMFMPLFGRLGDELGRSRMLLTGTAVFLLGSGLAFAADSLFLLFVGRIVQGFGAAGITPLSLALISQRFPETERGRALGTWNSIAPATGIFAPSLGGFLVDTIGWRTIFLPPLLVALFALFIVRWRIPTLRGEANWSVLRTFDWGGVLLLGGTAVFLVLFVSSRAITGVEPLQDWRLLLALALLGTGFVRWEKHQSSPLVDLRIWLQRNFRLASILAGLRMAFMAGIAFLMPLYLADLYNLSAGMIGLLTTIHSIALFVSIRSGGILADRWPFRWLLVPGFSLQMGIMAYFALLPAGLSLVWVGLGAVLHGLGAGLSLIALHRIALGQVAEKETGAAAGVYSMTRFTGLMLATAVAGVILQTGLNKGLTQLRAYQLTYGFLLFVGILAVILSIRLGNGTES